MDSVFGLLATKALYISLVISLIPVGAATCIGLVIAILQTLTQIQEQTLPFFFKMIGTFGALYLMSAWASNTLLEFVKLVYNSMA